jgi:hypothetical protein
MQITYLRDHRIHQRRQDRLRLQHSSSSFQRVARERSRPCCPARHQTLGEEKDAESGRLPCLWFSEHEESQFRIDVAQQVPKEAEKSVSACWQFGPIQHKPGDPPYPRARLKWLLTDSPSLHVAHCDSILLATGDNRGMLLGYCYVFILIMRFVGAHVRRFRIGGKHGTIFRS